MRFRLAVFASVAIGSSLAVAAEPIELKGFWVGMTRDQAAAAGGKAWLTKDLYTLDNATLGGAPVTFTIRLRGDVVDNVQVTSDAGDFEALRTAVVGKYAATRCVQGTVRTKRGSSFPSTTCSLSDGTTALVLTEHGNDIRSSTLQLMSQDARDKELSDQKKAAKDI